MRSSEMYCIKVLLVEDHAMVRTGLRHILSRLNDIEVVGEACNGLEALSLVDELKPHIVLMDVVMPVMDGVESARQILAKHEDVRIIMLTAHDRDEDIFASLTAGASGYCLKDAADQRIVTAIRAVSAGDVWLDAAIAKRVLGALPEPVMKSEATPDVDEGKVYESLSQREMEVLALVVDGLSNWEIGQRLFISPETVKTHMRRIMDKMAVSDRTQVAVKALKQGLL